MPLHQLFMRLCVLTSSFGHTVYAAPVLVSTAIGFDERMLLHSEVSYELVIYVIWASILHDIVFPRQGWPHFIAVNSMDDCHKSLSAPNCGVSETFHLIASCVCEMLLLQHVKERRQKLIIINFAIIQLVSFSFEARLK